MGCPKGLPQVLEFYKHQRCQTLPALRERRRRKLGDQPLGSSTNSGEKVSRSRTDSKRMWQILRGGLAGVNEFTPSPSIQCNYHDAPKSRLRHDATKDTPRRIWAMTRVCSLPTLALWWLCILPTVRMKKPMHHHFLDPDTASKQSHRPEVSKRSLPQPWSRMRRFA